MITSNLRPAPISEEGRIGLEGGRVPGRGSKRRSEQEPHKSAKQRAGEVAFMRHASAFRSMPALSMEESSPRATSGILSVRFCQRFWAVAWISPQTKHFPSPRLAPERIGLMPRLKSMSSGAPEDHAAAETETAIVSRSEFIGSIPSRNLTSPNRKRTRLRPHCAIAKNPGPRCGPGFVRKEA